MCQDCSLGKIVWKYIIQYMSGKLKSVEYFILCLIQDASFPLFTAIFELMIMDMSAVCPLLNFYGSRRRFPPRTEFVNARSRNPYLQYYGRSVTYLCNLFDKSWSWNNNVETLTAAVQTMHKHGVCMQGSNMWWGQFTARGEEGRKGRKCNRGQE